MAIVEEQTDLLVNVREDLVEAELDNGVFPNHSSSKKESSVGGKFKSSHSLSGKRHRLLLLLPSPQQCLFHLASLSHILLSVTLLVTIPVYSDVVSSVGGDSFGGLYFVSFFSTTTLVLLMALRKFWDPAFILFGNLPIKTVIKDAVIFGTGVLGSSYSRSNGRVPCHLQDGLLFLCIPISIIYMSIKKNKDTINKNVKLISMLAVFLALVFLSAVPQLSYKFVCRGMGIEFSEKPVEDSSSEALWTGAYIFCIALMSCSISSFLSCIQDHEDSSSQCLGWTSWFHVFTLTTITLLFWTDILSSIGGAGNLNEFWSKFSSVWVHHFTNATASSEPKLGFALPAFWLLFLYASNLLVYRFQSNPVFVVCNASLAIPLLPIFYSLFQLDPVVQARISFTLGGFFSLIVFPIAYTVLSCYHNASVILNLLDNFDIY